MRVIFCISGIIFFTCSAFTGKKNTVGYSQAVEDSTVHQRFIVDVLSEYDQPGRWIFVRVERCDTTNYEVLSVAAVYKMLNEVNTNLDKKSFAFIIGSTISQSNTISSCLRRRKLYNPNATYELEGQRVNVKELNLLKQMPTSKILATYFDGNKILKKRYKKQLNELIAVCYLNNVKVVGEGDNIAYEIFE